MSLMDFVTDSNAIEGIFRAPTFEELRGHREFLNLKSISVNDLEVLVAICAPGHVLRRRPGLDVRVGGYTAPPGGPGIEQQLVQLLGSINEGYLTPYEAHVKYEMLHPFTDGNGRSGRALWLWMHKGVIPYGLNFLHAWYYETLMNEQRS